MRPLRRRWCASATLISSAGAILASCTALGWRMGPGFPCTSGYMFEEPPVVERRGDNYTLTWTQGEFPFFFEPAYMPMDGRLVFALSGTASSGSYVGERREMPIQGTENLEALRRGGAAWWQRDPDQPDQDGRFIELSIVETASPAK